MDIFEFTANLPKKRMASGALILNERGEVLLVNPTYRDKWLIPGGMVEDNESPIQACERELKEELGIVIKVTRILCVDYAPKSEEGTECLHFVYFGGVLTKSREAKIQLCNTELSEYKFVTVDSLEHYLPPALFKRLDIALESSLTHESIYSEEGIRKDL